MRWLWRRLGSVFGGAIVTAWTPEQGQALVPAFQNEDAVDAMRRLLHTHSRRFSSGHARWDLHVSDVTTRALLMRSAAYVLTTPIKEGLVDDAAEWLWSSWRDIVGATADPLGDTAALAQTLGVEEAHLVPKLQRRIAAHPAVRGQARPVPDPVESCAHLTAALPTVASAVLASERAAPESIHLPGQVRDCVIALADEVGPPRASELATFLDVHESSIARARARERPDISAARMCLSDPRLTPPHTKPERAVVVRSTAAASTDQKPRASWWQTLKLRA